MGVSDPTRRSRALALLVASLLAGCSFGTVDRSPCARSSDCQQAFGVGVVCGADGFCRRPELPARCDQVFPLDLFRSERHRDALIFASLMDRSVTTQRARERAIRLAVTQANELGGVEGRTIGVLQCTIEVDPDRDDRTRLQAALAVADTLTDEVGIRAIVGPSASDDVEQVFTTVRDRGVLVISPSATSATLTDIDVTMPTDEEPGLLWRTAPPDPLQAAVIAEDLTARDVIGVVAIHGMGPYGTGLVRELDRSFGGDVALRPFDTSGARDEHIASAPSVADEVLFVSSQVSDAVAFLNSAAALGSYDEVGIFLTDSAANEDFLSGTAAGGGSARYPRVRGTRPALPEGFVFDAFVAAYIGAFDESPESFSFVAHSYDAAWMVIYAMAWAVTNEDALEGPNLARGLRRLSSGRSFEVRPGDFQGIVQAFREGSSVNITGTSGSLDYDLDTEETTGPIELWRIAEDGGAFERIRVVEP